MKLIDIIIPTYKPTKKLFEIIKLLEKQTYEINQIILMNTEEKYYNQLVYGTHIIEKYKNIQVCHLSKKEFDHGRTRNLGVKRSKADIFVCMTDDAVPIDEFFIEELVKGLDNPKVAIAYGRQLPNDDCGVVEQFTRSYNYPDTPIVKSLKDLPILGIKTYFCSNVCAAYKRDIYDELGGFIKHTIFNEDMIYAATAIKSGYEIAYVPTAKVKHSHNYTNSQQFHRNFDLGVSQADHPEVFLDIPSEGEGKKMVKMTAAYLKEKGLKNKVLSLYVKSGYKLIGYKLGKNYKKLPHKLVVSLSMNKDYWRLDKIKLDASKIDPTKGYGKTQEEWDMNRR